MHNFKGEKEVGFTYEVYVDVQEFLEFDAVWGQGEASPTIFSAYVVVLGKITSLVDKFIEIF